MTPAVYHAERWVDCSGWVSTLQLLATGTAHSRAQQDHHSTLCDSISSFGSSFGSSSSSSTGQR
jgi:hypothetical protein